MTDGFEELVAGVHTVLFAHAHPDDETLSSGALMAELAARGVRVVLLTATRGEEGEVVPGPLAALAGTDRLTMRREEELAGAVEVLGVAEHAWLGRPPARAAGLPERRYRDSGMRWVRPGLAGPSGRARPDSLFAADPDAVAADMRALLLAWRPDLVVSYDAHGGYGHPDHVAVRRAACRAAANCRVPFMELTARRGEDVLWFDGSPHVDTVERAVRRHASQVRLDSGDIVHSGGQRTPLQVSVGLRSVRGDAAC